MLSIVIQKELKSMLLSPKFAATFAVCAILILLSVFIGIHEYHAAVRQHEAAVQLTDQTLRSRSSWMGISTSAYRAPDPVQVFITGLTNDIGRFSTISQYSSVKLTNSSYSDDPLFAFFRAIDLSFVVTVVLSLFAILFTYDAINGEREDGTLQLTFANPVARGKYIMAKFIGGWLGLVIPLLVPVLLGILLVMLYGVPMATHHWIRLLVFLGMSLLYFTFFVAFGIFVSSLTRRTSVSFLISLVAWVTFVLILPRLGVMAAGHIRPVPSIAEVEAQRDAFSKDRWDKQMKEMGKKWQARDESMQGLSKEEREAYRSAHWSAWSEEDEGGRKQVLKDIDENSVRLDEDLRNRKVDQERLAFTLSRISPASAYQLAAMNLGGTDITLKARNEDAMRDYRTRFMQYAEKKAKETGGTGGFGIRFDSDKGFSFTAPRNLGALDISDMPAFTPPRPTIGEVAAAIVLDAGMLGLASLLAFAGAFVAFLRYDVRG
jgi:ABC-type transport system involved in multi-copper enzyme maturation permease subunit